MSPYGQILRNKREIIFNLFLYVKLEQFLSFVKKNSDFFKKIPFPGQVRKKNQNVSLLLHRQFDSLQNKRKIVAGSLKLRSGQPGNDFHFCKNE